MAKKKVSCLKKLPEAPARLGSTGKEQWEKIGSILVKEGKLYEIDLSILELICETWEQIRLADNPSVYMRLYTSLLEKFGATPKARMGMSQEAEDKPSKEDEELMDAFKNR